MKINFNLACSLLFSVCFALIACDQKGSADGSRERAAAEQQGARDVNNENLTRLAKGMEDDLALRHHFFDAIEGDFSGSLKMEDDFYQININLVRSLPAYMGSRTRQLSEVESDLNGLYFLVRISLSKFNSSLSSVFCHPIAVRPSFSTGVLTVASQDCANFYSLFLSEGPLQREQLNSKSFEENLKNQELGAQGLADKINSKAVHKVNFLRGTLKTPTSSKAYDLSVERSTHDH